MQRTTDEVGQKFVRGARPVGKQAAPVAPANSRAKGEPPTRARALRSLDELAQKSNCTLNLTSRALRIDVGLIHAAND